MEEGYGYPCRLVSEINTKYVKIDSNDIDWILQKIQRFEEVTINSNYFTLSLGKSFEKSELMTQDFLSTAIQTIEELYPIYQFYKDAL